MSDSLRQNILPSGATDVNRTNKSRFTIFHRLRKRPGLASILVGGSVVLLFVVVGIGAPLFAPYDPSLQALSGRLLPPAWMEGGSSAHLLGTDGLGRDILSRTIYGTRISLIVGFAVVFGSGVIGILLGLISGYAGRRIDGFIQRIVELFQVFPFLLLAIAVMAFLGQGLTNLIIVLVAMRWIQYCRVTRSEVLSLKTRNYVTAAKASGVRTPTIVWRHILPNTMASSIVVATFSLAQAILSEAALSFLGLGVPPAVPTWGTMLAEGRDYMYAAPWTTIVPGLAVFFFVLPANIVGDGIRDWIDPKLRGA